MPQDWSVSRVSLLLTWGKRENPSKTTLAIEGGWSLLQPGGALCCPGVGRFLIALMARWIPGRPGRLVLI